MKFRWGFRPTSKKVLANSLEEQNSSKINDAALSASKEEIFFDSQAWLDSDCEDDFVSVYGDFTPSRGSTPIHRTSSNSTPQWDKYFSSVTVSNSESVPFPTDGKRRLSELLRGNVANGKVDNSTEPELSEVEAENHSAYPSGTPNFSGTNSACNSTNGTPIKDSKGTPNKYLKEYKERMSKTKHCCLPSLMHSLSFKEKRKPKMSPVH